MWTPLKWRSLTQTTEKTCYGRTITKMTSAWTQGVPTCSVWPQFKKSTAEMLGGRSKPAWSMTTSQMVKCYRYRPQAVEDVSIRKDTQHDVICGGVVDEGPLRVHKEDIRDPDLLHQATIERHALVGAAGERQALVLPVVPQVQSHGEVLVESKDERMRHGVLEIHYQITQSHVGRWPVTSERKPLKTSSSGSWPDTKWNGTTCDKTPEMLHSLL